MDSIEEIKKLKALLDQGAINDVEFQRLKSSLLSNNQPSTFGSSERKVRQNSKSKRGNGLIYFFITLLVFALLVLVYLNKKGTIKLNFNILSNQKENINSNNIDSLKLFDNNIYNKGLVVGKLVIIEFVKNSNQYGHVFNIPKEKMWTPLFFKYEDLGNNYSIKIPELLTEQNENQRIGRDYFYMNIYDDKATNTWWEKGISTYFQEQKDFKSIKLSMRTKKAISGKNAIYVQGYETNVKYIFYFFEESIR
jgi:hypothetical protein